MIKNLLLFLTIFASPNKEIKSDTSYNNLYEKDLHRFANRGLKESYLSSVFVFSTNEIEVESMGSGNYFSYKGKRFVLTAAHVVIGHENIFVGGKGEEVSQAFPAFINKEKDIAILKLEKELTFTKAIPFKKDEDKKIGKKVYHTGHPDGQSWHVSEGLLASTGDEFLILNTFAWPGSSGSVILDERGRAIGVVSSVRISQPMGLPDMVEHIVAISNIDNISIYELHRALCVN